MNGTPRGRTDIVSKGVAPTAPLVDPRPIYVIAVVVAEIFPGISNGGIADVYGGEITQKCAGIARVEDRGEGRPYGEALDQPLVKRLEKEVSVLML